MEAKEIKEIIKKELPQIIQTDEEVARYILKLSYQYYAGKVETENRFDRILNELQKDREEQRRKWEEHNRQSESRWEEQNRKWEEHNRQSESKWEEQNRKWEEHNRQSESKWEEQNRQSESKWEEHNRQSESKWEEHNRQSESKWEEQNRKWEENQKIIRELFEELKVINRKHDQTIGALGARWGLHSEASFRNALAGILEESFKVQVLHINEFDDKGEVFGRPDQVELDLLIKNGLLIICEIKSSMSKADMYVFDRKVRYYETRHECKANRKIIISPMIDEKTTSLARGLGMEVYSYVEDVER